MDPSVDNEALRIGESERLRAETSRMAAREREADEERRQDRIRQEQERALCRPPKVVGESEYLRRERCEIEKSRADRLGPDATTAPWAGLGLSGGGIRSASLSLGVLQALAEADLLRRFDYISSVSGGGYLAGALQWWWQRGDRADGTRNTQTSFGLGPDDFPYGPARLPTEKEGATKKRGRANLDFLRSHSAYLIPGNGLTSWSMAAVLARTIVISLFIWIPLLAGIFALLHEIDGYLLENWAHDFGLWSPLHELVPSRWTEARTDEDGAFLFRVVYALALWAVYGFIAFFWVAAIVFAFVSRAPQSDSGRWTIPVFSVVSLLSALFLITALMKFGAFDGSLKVLTFVAALLIAISVGLILAELHTERSLNASYWLRRKLEVLLGRAFLPMTGCLAIALVPIVPYLASDNYAAGKLTAAGVFGLLSGIGSAVYGYYTFIRNVAPGIAARIAATLGATIYLYATLVIGYCLALVWTDNIVGWRFLAYVLWGLFLVALTLGLYANINYVGLHRFYRDRLMEAFLPTDKAVSDDKSEPSPVADNLLVSALQTRTGGVQPVPYPLINTNVILVNDEDQKYAIRGGDNFVISPLFVGSTATEWQETKTYIQEKGPLTLASTVAASGAAATASAGYIGTGITMDPLVAAVMSLLNIRLGLWVPNPRRERFSGFNLIPTFLYPGLISGVLASRHSKNSRFIELTDGGHFENLGLYELVRRELPLILIVDGEADPTISLASLVSAARRIEQDFNVTLTFVDGRGPESLMMYDQKGYPAGLRYAAEPFMIGKLRYGHDRFGTLIYLKSTLIKNLDFTTAGYLAANPTFPHQSTVDQFFDADQFDAYRYLGYDAAKLMIETLELRTSIAKPDCLRQRQPASGTAGAMSYS
ncbi:patatin-like phospholipase family protein [Bradyrhizobium sp. ORS 86]|uniref:patatin-like phospholipase family protein n=1 Tax=Bradyrhizobium sp. ORS 86 TaxID=1685970 RepID=UPI00388E260A